MAGSDPPLWPWQGTEAADQRRILAPFRQPTRKQMQLVDQEQLPPLPGLLTNAPRPTRLNTALNAPRPAPLNTPRVPLPTPETSGYHVPGPQGFRTPVSRTRPPPGFAGRPRADLASTADSGWGEPYMPPAPVAAAGPGTGTGVFVPQRMARR